jgi:hypothetical protein
MRDAAAACNAAIRADKQEVAKGALRQMMRACDDCHEHFKVD